tara:strand:- start:9312 stop:11258 length:1947 start_codon:yes stop_codon:yes gene_type:complete
LADRPVKVAFYSNLALDPSDNRRVGFLPDDAPGNPSRDSSLISFLKHFFTQIYRFLVTDPLDPLPVRRDLATYRWPLFREDIRAGFNVALLAIPQGMAYAVIAEVPIYFGITCSAIASLVAALFSGSRHTILGPTNATAFMLFSFFAAVPGGEAFKIGIMPLMVFFVGILLVVGAYFKVADLIQYISRSVVVGYITGAALLIIANQMRQVLGIEFAEGEARPRTFFSIVEFLLSHLGKVEWAPLLLSVFTAGIYFLLLRRLKGWPVFAITLALTTALNAALSGLHFQVATFEAFGFDELRPRIPRFSDAGVLEDLHFLFSVSFSLAFLCALENSVMSKTLASRTGDRPDQNQDMMSIGIANLVTSFFSVLPCSGSLTRSQLNFNSGAKTRLASMFSGLICAIGAVILANPLLQIITFVPKCALAALVICIAISLISPKNIRICLGATRSDAAVLLVTFSCALILPLHTAIFMGVALSIIAYLHKASKPELVEYNLSEEGEVMEDQQRRHHPKISFVHVEGELFFGAAELFRSQIQRTFQDPDLRIIILRMRNAHRLDATSVMALEELVRFLRSAQRHLLISGATPEVWKVLNNSGAIDTIGEENIFLHDAGNPNLPNRYALKRSQQLLGTKEAEVEIFTTQESPREEP